MTAPDTTDETAFDLRARAELALAFDPGPPGVNPLENYKRQRRAFRSSRLRLGHCTNLSLG
jgi:hypothetical protein